MRRRRIAMSDRCIGRFHEHFGPAIEMNRARSELKRLLREGHIDAEGPRGPEGERRAPERYLIVGVGLVLPLEAGPEHERLAAACRALCDESWMRGPAEGDRWALRHRRRWRRRR